ncbi:hypothetical protein ACWA1F_20790 [Flavobacterium sp. 3-218]
MEKFSKLVLVFFIIVAFGLFMKGHFYSKEIYENPGQTICKYTFCKQFPKTNTAYVKYYIDNKLYRNKAGRCPENYDMTIDKYFILNYSTNDPNKIRVDFSKEIKDSILIKELELKIDSTLY